MKPRPQFAISQATATGTAPAHVSRCASVPLRQPYPMARPQLHSSSSVWDVQSLTASCANMRPTLVRCIIQPTALAKKTRSCQQFCHLSLSGDVHANLFILAANVNDARQRVIHSYREWLRAVCRYYDQDIGHLWLTQLFLGSRDSDNVLPQHASLRSANQAAPGI